VVQLVVQQAERLVVQLVAQQAVVPAAEMAATSSSNSNPIPSGQRVTESEVPAGRSS